MISLSPDEIDSALESINKSIGGQLTPDDVHMFSAVAATGEYVPSYYLHLGNSTLQNIANDAAAGVALMPHHDVSQYPLGYSYSSNYTSGSPGKTLVNFYLLRNLSPQGYSGPSTDDIYRMISAGTLRDVSVGLSQGDSICDVCNKPIWDLDTKGKYVCSHIPGTTIGMTPLQISSQKLRRIPKGVATYTLENAHLQEISLVYSGACPGATILHRMSTASQLSVSRKALKLRALNLNN